MRGVALTVAGMLLATGCQKVLGIDGTRLADDSGTDAGVDTRYCNWPLTPHNFDPCDAPSPTSNLALELSGTYTLDTSGDGSLIDPGDNTIDIVTATIDLTNGTEALLVSAKSFSVGIMTTLQVTGDRPLIIMAAGSEGQPMTGNATVLGTISVASRLEGGVFVDGPGGNADPECETGGTGRTSNDTLGGAGAGGGGFGDRGGAGGNGGTSGGGGHFGEASANLSLDPLRGGCAGGEGSYNGVGGMTQGPMTPAGGAGGAIEIAAHDLIRVEGTINAAGGGGGGGAEESNGGDGGGGGGSGGGILLDAASIELVDASLCANGGSGGEGGVGGTTGAQGVSGTCTNDAAIGEQLTGNAGGKGGDGGYANAPSGRTANDPSSGVMGGGGGGGGSVGIIQLHYTGAPTLEGGTIVTPNATFDAQT